MRIFMETKQINKIRSLLTEISMAMFRAGYFNGRRVSKPEDDEHLKDLEERNKIMAEEAANKILYLL